MGQVKIIENKGEGLYRVEIIKDVERAKKRVEFLNEQITKMNAELTDMLAKVPGIESRLNAALLVVEQKRQDMAENDYWLDQAKQALVTANNELDLLELNRSIIQADIDTLQAEIDSGTLTQPEIDARVIQIAALQVQRNSLSDQIAVKKADIKGIEANIDRLSDYSKLVKSIEEAVLEAEKIGMEFDRLRVQIRVHETIIAAKQKTAQEYAAVIADKDEQDAWAIDYAVDLTAREQPYVSIEIEDEPEGVKIGAYTYTPIQEDIDLKQSVYDEVVTKQEEYHQKYLDEQALATEWAGKVFEVEQKIVQVSLTIATLEGVNEDGFYTTQIENLNLELEDLKRELQTLMLEQAKHENLAKKWQGKEVALLPKRNRLAKDIQDLTPVVAANEVYKPVVNEFTKKFQPTQASSPEAVFFNKSLLPGVQKWMPTFRRGTITAIHPNDLCDVELFDGLSSQQNLKINRQNNLINVPIKYGDCNADAFVVGDEVVVEFKEQKQDKPVVVGFQTHPKECNKRGIVFRPVSDDAPSGWGLPITAQNEPIGTIGGNNPHYKVTFSAPPKKPFIKRNISTVKGGNIWAKCGKEVYSFHGPHGFFIVPEVTASVWSDASGFSLADYELQQVTFQSPQHPVTGGRVNRTYSNYHRGFGLLYKDGKDFLSLASKIHGIGKVGNYVCAVLNDTNQQDKIYYIDHENNNSLVEFGIINYALHFLNPEEQKVMKRNRIYSFSDDGTKAVSLIDVTRMYWQTEPTIALLDEPWADICRLTFEVGQDNKPLLKSQTHELFYNRPNYTYPEPIDYINGRPGTYNRQGTTVNGDYLIGIGFKVNEEIKISRLQNYTESSTAILGTTTTDETNVFDETITYKIGIDIIGISTVNFNYEKNEFLTSGLPEGNLSIILNNSHICLLYANIYDNSYAYLRRDTSMSCLSNYRENNNPKITDAGTLQDTIYLVTNNETKQLFNYDGTI